MEHRHADEHLAEHHPGVSPTAVPPAPRALALWFGLLGGPATALAVQSLLYSGAPWGCIRGTHAWMHGMAVAALVFTVVAGLVAWRCWAEVGADWSPEGVDPEGADAPSRARFMGAAGVIASAFSFLLVLAMWLPVFFLNPCVRT